MRWKDFFGFARKAAPVLMPTETRRFEELQDIAQGVTVAGDELRALRAKYAVLLARSDKQQQEIALKDDKIAQLAIENHDKSVATDNFVRMHKELSETHLTEEAAEIVAQYTDRAYEASMLRSPVIQLPPIYDNI